MRSVYFDTSDVSYLLKGRAPPHVGDIVAHRARLERLVRAERAGLFVSFVHLGEIAVKPSLTAAALEWLDRGLPVSIILTGAEAIFRAELRRESLPITTMPLTREILNAVRIPLRMGPINTSVTGAQAARAVKNITQMWAWAENAGKRARRRRTGVSAHEHRVKLRASDRATDDLLRGDTSSMTWPMRGVAEALHVFAPRLLARRGLTLADLRRHVRLVPGRSWITGLVESDGWDAAQAVIRDPSQAPGSALRDAIENWEARDPTRPARSGTLYDVNHVAYAARCEIATLDGPNFRATAAVRQKLPRTQFFETAQIGAVLDAIESGAE